MAIHVAKREPLTSPKPGQCDPSRLDNILTGLIGVQDRATTALLAVIAELLVDDPTRQLRCRREVAERRDHLPGWISALPRVDVYRAVRRTHVLGDVDELVVGMRLAGGHELTIAVEIDHNMWSSVVDAGVVPDPIDEALARVAESSTDTDVLEMSLADARVWIEDALNKPALAPETDAWPRYRALVQWLVGRLPEGGEGRSPVGEWEANEELCDRFFTTGPPPPPAALQRGQLSVGGRAGRTRSAARFIPYAHAQSGIRDELTTQTLAMVDALRSSYKREVLRQAKYWDLDDAV